MHNEHNTLAQPQAEGLYEPSTERAACGVGFVVQMHGKKSHDIVRKGIEILVNLTHRGGCGCDPRTGDGAGILTQIPHEFLVEECAELGITLPEPGEYGAGFLFLPRLAHEGAFCQNRLMAIIREEGQEFLGWRTPPTERSCLGWIAQDVEPYMKQVFIGRGKDTPADMFEWKLYVIRKRIEQEVRNSRLLQKAYFYVPSLSSRTIVYKGLMLTDAVDGFYPDLKSEKFVSALALVHQRFSTNTFPSWDLAQPFRYLAHNGEINTLRGNVNWMRARESMFASEKYGADLKKLGPICTPNASDTAIFDNTLELLIVTGRSLTQAMTMMIPEPWDHHETMSEEKKAYYEYQACLMEPWDGPACIAFTDGTCMGASLDRNGLRPSRYWVTNDGLVVMASEAGVLQIPQDEVVKKGRLQPGRMFLVDTTQGRIVSDDEIKHGLAARKPYREWLKANQKTLAGVMEKYYAAKEKSANGKPEHGKSENGKSANGHANGHGEHLSKEAKEGLYGSFSESDLTRLQRTFGYSLEDLRILIAPMAEAGLEAIGSMGTDTPLAVLSERPQILYSYFKQLFAQVTNPP
ncbi:MAG TPA: glutamate synthase central domain-containing protein, partial [Pirellulales bacterium]